MKLSTKQQEIVEDMQKGSIIYCYHEHGETKYRTMMGTCERLNLSVSTFSVLLSRGIILPNNDGLFGDSQTWRLSDGD